MIKLRSDLPVMAFGDQAELEVWLSAQPNHSPGAWIRFRKKGTDIPRVTKAEAIDSALWFGWIDGQLDKYDADSWLIRFTSRRSQSKWSEVNRQRALELVSAGRTSQR